MTASAPASKTSVAAISILASGSMAVAKLVVGIAIGSLALISEALHSSIDLVATIITWAVVRVSDLPADEEHHYGHGKFESLSALFVIALLYVLAGGILVESWSRLRDGAAPPTLSVIPFAVLVVDIAVNFWRARALHRAARATQSQALAADALHFASDVLGSIAVIIGLVLIGFGYAWGDAVAAIAVAIMIALLGLRLARSTVERAIRNPRAAIMMATAMAAAASPHQKPRPASASPMMTATEPSTSEVKCSASAASAWLLVSRAVRCRARARQKFTAISITSTTKGTAETIGGGVPSRRRPKASTRMPPAST